MVLRPRSSLIQLTRDGLAGSARIDELECQFEREHVFRLTRLLHPDLMQMISSRLDCGAWMTRDDADIAREAVPVGPGPVSILNFAANTPEFLELIRRITRCSQITWFGGRVYRMAPDSNHFDSWHGDLGSAHDHRLVGMSINLGPRPYQGGIFRLRDEASGEILCDLPNTGQGDAIFFGISPALMHMVTPIEGTEPKTAFAGWFRSGNVDLYTRLLRKNSSSARTERVSE
jgi:hypothetical protein